jgi:putative sigma-54 modulation protein
VAILVKFEHFIVKVSASSTDMYASIDEAVNRLQVKLQRWKSRIQDHSAKKRTAIDMTVNVIRHPYNVVEEINAEIEFENRKKEEADQSKAIVRRCRRLTTEEAVRRWIFPMQTFLFSARRIETHDHREDNRSILPE